LKAELTQELIQRFEKLVQQSESGKVAVRSSALQEDSSQASHAGEFTSVLNVASTGALLQAVSAVLSSGRQTTQQGANATMAVIVQELIEPDHAGVMFTVDPVTGDANLVVGNFVKGLADALLTGDRDAQTFRINKHSGAYGGDADLRQHGSALLTLALQLEQRFGTPVDIEWAVRKAQIFILQCRPVTAVGAVADVWNDSLNGDYLWTNTNTGEAFDGTLTPLSASTFLNVFRSAMGTLNGAPAVGLIAGRLYLNLSYSLAIYKKMGVKDGVARKTLALLGGTIPEGITVPVFRIGTGEFLLLLAKLIKQALFYGFRIHAWRRWLRHSCPSWCEAMLAKVDSSTNTSQLLALAGAEDVRGKVLKMFPLLLMTMNALTRQRMELEAQLAKHLSEDDLATLLSGLGQGEQLESLQPLLGFSAMMKGEISREEFFRRYGHRSVKEIEVAAPRLAEDTAWLELLAAQWTQSKPEMLVSAQHAARAAIWDTLGENAAASKLKRRYQRCTSLMQDRELIRSEAMRMGWVSRKLILKAAQLSGLSDELFFLEDNEFWAFMAGDKTVLGHVPARKRLYEVCSKLPRLPSYISGTFRPHEWQHNPARRIDRYDAHAELSPVQDAVLKGFPGSAGVVEGLVRVLESPQQFAQLQNGEILVTSHTNIGWTLIFPRVAAIVTDIGAPLSHTAIVARELGIPAVVGTGVATSQLKTGDRIRVNGTAGTVEFLGSGQS
jgi:rifampicin phosphotransferase